MLKIFILGCFLIHVPYVRFAQGQFLERCIDQEDCLTGAGSTLFCCHDLTPSVFGVCCTYHQYYGESNGQSCAFVSQCQSNERYVYCCSYNQCCLRDDTEHLSDQSLELLSLLLITAILCTPFLVAALICVLVNVVKKRQRDNNQLGEILAVSRNVEVNGTSANRNPPLSPPSYAEILKSDSNMCGDNRNSDLPPPYLMSSHAATSGQRMGQCLEPPDELLMENIDLDETSDSLIQSKSR